MVATRIHSRQRNAPEIDDTHECAICSKSVLTAMSASSSKDINLPKHRIQLPWTENSTTNNDPSTPYQTLTLEDFSPICTSSPSVMGGVAEA